MDLTNRTDPDEQYDNRFKGEVFNAMVNNLINNKIAKNHMWGVQTIPKPSVN